MNKLYNHMLAVIVLVILASAAWAQTPIGPGLPYPAASEISDQKAGSVLIYNLYSSQSASPNAENTRVNITNINPSLTINVHLFFVDGASCAPADAFICLTPNQTATFLTSDIDPDVMGYIVAVASDSYTGCPVNFNFLIGDEYVKLASGHSANLGAEAIAAVFSDTVLTPLPGCDPTSTTAALVFDGVSYNRIPRVLAIDSIASQADGNSTCLVLNRISGDLQTGADAIGPVFSLIFDDSELPFSFSFSSSRCQFKGLLSSFRMVGGNINSIIPSGRSGWLKLYNPSADVGLLGAVLNFNPYVALSPTAFSGGHNLHKLTLSASNTYIIPVFPPFC
jgi:hypothetical protein